MKKYLIITILVLLVWPVLHLVNYCNRPKIEMVTVKKSYLDSIKLAAEIRALPPQVITIERRVPGETVYIDRVVPVPVPDGRDSTIKIYNDSLVNKEVHAGVSLKVKGSLEKISWSYEPIITEITKTIYEPQPYPVPYEKKVPQNGAYGSLGFGRGAGSTIFSAGITYLNKKGKLVGLEAGHFQSNYIKLNLGVKF